MNRMTEQYLTNLSIIHLEPNRLRYSFVDFIGRLYEDIYFEKTTLSYVLVSRMRLITYNLNYMCILSPIKCYYVESCGFS